MRGGIIFEREETWRTVYFFDAFQKLPSFYEVNLQPSNPFASLINKNTRRRPLVVIVREVYF